MKILPLSSRTYQGIEVLESRIAPASVFYNFTDQDGDTVKVTSSKGTAPQLAAAFTLSGGATGFAAVIDLTAKVGTTSIFAGADITIEATVAGGGDGLVRVELINATGVDLGKVTIDGELDSITAGDGNSATAGLKSITVGTWGNGFAYDSNVIGAITTLKVNGDFNGAFLQVAGSASDLTHTPAAFDPTDFDGEIGTLFIGGSLLGTERQPLPGETVGRNSGHISATGDISKATVAGSIVGFSDTQSLVAAVPQEFNARLFSRGVIGSLSVGTDAVPGNIQGGDGSSSGQVVGVSGIGNVTVKGSVLGGLGTESGSIGAVGTMGKVLITGDLIGDMGDRSGTILAFTSISSVKIGGNIEGGGGENSGAIGAGSAFSEIPGVVKIGAVTVGGDIIGGDGASSGQIVSQGTITSVTVEGSLIGGSEFETGAIGSLKGLGAIVIKGDILAGSGDRSGFIATEEEPIPVDGGPAPDPGLANAPIASVTVGGSIIGTNDDGGGFTGYRAGGILSSGNLGPVVVLGDVIGGGNDETGRIASSHAITSVKIGGHLDGGEGNDSGSIFAQTTLGPVSIGDPAYDGGPIGGFRPVSTDGFSGLGIVGGSGFHSGSVIAGTLAKIDVYGDLQGDLGEESGVIETFGSGAAGKMGAVYVRGNVIGGIGSSSVRSGAIISSGAIASVLIGTDTFGESQLIGGDGRESGNIISHLDMGVVYIEDAMTGGVGDDSGRISSDGKIAAVYIGGKLQGGGGDGSGSIVSGGDLGPVFIGVGGTAADIHRNGAVGSGADLIGGLGDHSGAVIAGGKLAKIDINGYLLGGDGPFSGRIETQGEGTLGNMGPVFIAKSLIGTTGPSTAVESGQIFSSGKIASVVIGDPKDTDSESGGSLTGGNAKGSGSILSELDLGPVKIKRSLVGGTGDETGKIVTGGKLASLTVGSEAFSGSIIGGTGNYDTTSENVDAQLGQVFAAGTIGAVTVFGDVQGNPTDSEGGRYSGQVRGLSIASVTVRGNLKGGLGDYSGGFFATSQNIGAVIIDGYLEGGGGSQSGFLSAEGNLTSVKIGASLAGGSGSGSGYVAAGANLTSFLAEFASGDAETSRPRISAGKMIGSVTIERSIFNTDILAGYNTSGFEFNPDAQIGTVLIGSVSGGEFVSGIMQGTNIVAGISAGTDGVFGNSNDHLILGAGSATVFSKIASVIVKGAINNTSNSADRFGILAENIVSLKVGSSTLPLTGGPLNDDYKPTGPSSDTIYGERLID